MRFLIMPRSTIISTKPHFSWNSADWKSSGSRWRIVSWITRLPAKPMSTFGSASMMSPRLAKEAVTPPVVGSVMTEM